MPSTALATSLVLSLAALSGCARDETPQPQPLSGPVALHGAGARVDGGLPNAAPRGGLVSYGRSTVGAPGSVGETGGGDVTLNFAATDIRAVVNEILGDILHVNYAIDPNVQGTATLRTVEPLRRDQLLPVLRNLLTGSSAALIEENGLHHVVATTPGQGPGAGVGAAVGETAIPLRYAGAADLARVLQPFQPPGGHIGADAASNAVIVSGDPATRQSLIDLVHAFDVDSLAGQSYALFPTSTGNAQELAQALQQALGVSKSGNHDGQVQVVPMARIDSVMVIARTARLVENARRAFDLIEAGRRRTIRSWNVYYLQNNRANDVAYVLQQAFTPDHVTAQPTQAHTTSQSSFGNSSQSGFGGAGNQGGQMGGSLSGLGGGGGTGGTTGGLGGNQSSFGQGQGGGTQTGTGQQGGNTQDSVANNPLLGGLSGSDQGSGGGSGNRDSIRIIPDTQNNAVLVYGTAGENATVAAMLHKIDIMPVQVRIDATIAEVTLNDNLQYGTQFFFKSGGVNGLLSNQSNGSLTSSLATAALSSSLPGLVIGGLSGGGAPFVINALQKVTTVQVLSSPQLMVTDNQPASLMVGDLVPYLTGSTTGILTTNSTITNQVNYQPTGVIMQVTPRISNGDMVTMDISQQVSSVDNSTTATSGSGSINSPTFSERQVTSRVTIADGQTVGLAGLISDNRQRGNQGIPWLKNIPVLGLLGGSQTNTRARTELLVLLTPHVIHNQLEAHNLTEDLRDNLAHAAVLPEMLSHTPMSGSPDPQHGVLHGLGLRD